MIYIHIHTCIKAILFLSKHPIIKLFYEIFTYFKVWQFSNIIQCGKCFHILENFFNRQGVSNLT